MSVIFDKPKKYRFQGRLVRSGHLISTLNGEEGRAELLAFGEKIGMRAQWLQKRGTPQEHFDLFGSKVEQAVAAGARQASDREWVEARQAKT